MKMTIKKIEKAFGIKVRKNITVLGLDTATKTGYCIAKSNSKSIDFSVGCINLSMKEIKDRDLRNELRFEELFKIFRDLIKKEHVVVVENVYHGFNAQTTILLARIGAIAWTIAKVKQCSEIIWKTAIQARKAIGLPCNKKKPIIVKAVNDALNTSFKNNDEIDAIVLALNGLIEEK